MIKIRVPVLARNTSLPSKLKRPSGFGRLRNKTSSLNSVSFIRVSYDSYEDGETNSNLALNTVEEHSLPNYIDGQDKLDQGDDNSSTQKEIMMTKSCESFESRLSSISEERKSFTKLKSYATTPNLPRKITEVSEPSDEVETDSRLASFDDSYCSFLTAKDVPALTSDGLQYYPKYPILKKHYHVSASVHDLTVFTRSGLNEFLVPMNLVLVKTSWFDVQFAFFQHKDRQIQLNEHALNMSRLIYAFRDILTCSYPSENLSGLTFTNIKNEIKRLLSLNSEAIMFCAEVERLWHGITQALDSETESDDSNSGSLQSILDIYNRSSSGRLPSLNDYPLLDKNLSLLLVLIQKQYHKYFKPDQLLGSSTAKLTEWEKRNLLRDINEFIKESSTSKKWSIAPGTVFASIAKQSLLNHNFLFLSQPKHKWPGLLQALYIDRTSGLFGVIPSSFDDSWRLQSKTSNKCIMPFLINSALLSQAFINSGSLVGSWSYKDYQVFYAVSLANGHKRFEQIDYPLVETDFKLTFSNQNLSFIRTCVQNNFKNLLTGKLKPHSDFLHLMEFHAVFLKSTPFNLSILTFREIINTVLSYLNTS